MNNYAKIGERIKSVRLEKGLTLQELGAKVGLSHASLSKYESGNVSNIPINRISDIAKALDVDPGYLMGWNKGESPQARIINRLIELTKREKINWDYIKEPHNYFTNLSINDALDLDKRCLCSLENKYNIIEGYIYNYDKGFYYLVIQGKFLDLGIDYNTNEDTEIYDYSTHLYASNKKNIIDLFDSNTKDLLNDLYHTIINSLNNPENEVINDLLNDLDSFTEN